jgi:hypothetical protein
MKVLDTTQKEFLDWVCAQDDSCDIACDYVHINEADAQVEENQYMTKRQNKKERILR